jgi:hypothetical protein
MPHHVDHDARDEHVHLGHRKAGVAAELEEPALELGASERRRSKVVVEHGSERRQATARMAPMHHALDGPEVEELQAFRLVDSVFQTLTWQDTGQVHERSGDRRDRDAVNDSPILLGQVAGPVEHDAAPAVASSRRHHMNLCA